MLWNVLSLFVYFVSQSGFSPELLQLVVHLCLINDLWGLVNNGCGQLHMRELQIHDSCNAEKQNYFDEQASADILTILVRADGVFSDNCSMAQEHRKF